MKRKDSKEPDVYVVNRKPSKQEIKDLAEFVKKHKRKHKPKRHSRAA